jgi:hypothetical protein
MRLPSLLFRCASLCRLYIGVWAYPDTTALPLGVAFPNLHQLALGCVFMEDKDLDFVLAVSPMLEILSFFGSLPHHALVLPTTAYGVCCSACPSWRRSPCWTPQAWSASSSGEIGMSGMSKLASRLAMPRSYVCWDTWSQECICCRSETPSSRYDQRLVHGRLGHPPDLSSGLY